MHPCNQIYLYFLKINKILLHHLQTCKKQFKTFLIKTIKFDNWENVSTLLFFNNLKSLINFSNLEFNVLECNYGYRTNKAIKKITYLNIPVNSQNIFFLEKLIYFQKRSKKHSFNTSRPVRLSVRINGQLENSLFQACQNCPNDFKLSKIIPLPVWYLVKSVATLQPITRTSVCPYQKILAFIIH